MPKTTQITVTAESKPGVLAKVSDALGKAGVNIVAVCAADSAGRGKIRLVVSDPARAKEALAAAKINIKCAYASTGGGARTQLVVAVANPDKAERALG